MDRFDLFLFMSTKTDLKKKLSEVSESPGVYLMKDAKGKIIYTGKALNLKKRLSSYFREDRRLLDSKTKSLIENIVSFETILTATEKEALILESSIVRHEKPKYNIDLKDDKRYPFLKLDITLKYPTLSIVRKTPDNGALYFGPYTSVKDAKNTFRIIKKTFKLRKCTQENFKNRSRPCLHFQMNRCLGPCCFDIDQSDYLQMVNEVSMFLKGKAPQLVREIKLLMLKASEQQQYEKAAELRDKITAIERTLERQITASSDFKDRDAIALASGPGIRLLQVISVRGGFVQCAKDYQFENTLSYGPEMISFFIRQYYQKTGFVPGEIFVTDLPEDFKLIEEILEEIRGKKVKISCPSKGEKADILKMASKNAEIRLKDYIADKASRKQILENLKQQMHTFKTPFRIECFDNSNLSGTNPTSAMVVFENGLPVQTYYRKYNIKTVIDTGDDYAYMNEVLMRRYGKGEKSKPFPDLLLVDGGRGQLRIASKVLQELGIASEFDIASIAKKNEALNEESDKIYRPGRQNPLNISRDSLLFLQRIRDEAHRAAITFHRKKRKSSTIRSDLDSIPGMGPKRKAALLRHFKSIDRIKNANIEEISKVEGISHKAAESIKQYFLLLE